MSYKFNPFTDKLDLVGTSSGPGSGILTINTIGPDGGGNFTLESTDSSITFTPVANGLDLSASGAGGTTTYDIDVGGPISPIAGVLQLLGIGGNQTVSSGAGIIDVNNLYWLSPYVVDASTTPGLDAKYQTVQAAINAASAAGGGKVYIRQGTYTENLTLLPEVSLIGVDIDGEIAQVDPTHTVNIVGTHTFTGPGSVLCQGIFFTANSASPVFTTASASGVMLLGFQYCLIDNSSTGLAVDFVNNGAFAVFSMKEASVIANSGDAIHVDANSLFNFTNVQVTSQGGDAIVALNAGNCINGAITAFNTAFNLSGAGNNYNVKNSTIQGKLAYSLNGGGVGVLSTGNLIGTNDASGFYVAGTGNYQYANESFAGNKNIDPGITEQPLAWKPYCTDGNTTTAVRGTASFDSTQFTVTDGFVQANGGAITTQYDIDVGGPITPVAGVLDLFGLGGNQTVSLGAGQININNLYWLSQYVVDQSTTPGLDAKYQTIQSAINQAFADGGGDVYVRRGSYTEDLVFQPGVNLIGTGVDGRLAIFPPASNVTITGSHTYSGDGTALSRGISFVGTPGNNVITMSGATTFSVMAVENCSIVADAAGLAAVSVDALGSGGALIACVESQVTGTTVGIQCTNGGGNSALRTQIAGTNGPAIIMDPGAQFIAFYTECILEGSTDCLQLGINAAAQFNYCQVTGNNGFAYNFTSTGGTVQAYHGTVSANSGTGFYISGTGTYQYCDEVILSGTKNIDPAVTQQPATWKPYATDGLAGGGVRGTAAFDSNSFTVTDGFVQLAGGGGVVTSFDIDTGGPISPVAGVITLNGIGGNTTGTTGAGEIFVDNEFWLSSFVVDPNATPGSRGSFTTIQAAINAAFGGPGVANIYIRPGTYTEDLIFHIGINLIGVGPSEKALSTGFNNDVIIVGVHSLTGEDGSIRLENLTFQANSGTALITIDSATGASQCAITDCSINNLTGSAFLVGSTGGVSAGLSMDNCFVLSDSAALSFTATGIFSINNSTIISTGGPAIQWVQGTGLSGQVNDCFLTGSGVGLNLSGSGSLLELTNSIINSGIGAFFSAGTPVLYSLHNTWNCFDGSGQYILGAGGTYNYADDVLIGSATVIDPAVTANPQVWKPFCTSGNTTTAVRGTAGFDSGDFTVVDGFVQLANHTTITWQRISGNMPTVSNNGYFCVSPGGTLSLSLPATSAIGDIVELNVRGATGFILNQAAGQTIFIGANQTTTGVAGSIASIAQGDSLKLVCSQTNTDWDVVSSVGSFTLT